VSSMGRKKRKRMRPRHVSDPKKPHSKPIKVKRPGESHEDRQLLIDMVHQLRARTDVIQYVKLIWNKGVIRIRVKKRGQRDVPFGKALPELRSGVFVRELEKLQ